MEYKVIKAWNIKELEDMVQAKIEKGFKPLGGVCLSHDSNSRCDEYCQAMIKEY